MSHEPINSTTNSAATVNSSTGMPKRPRQIPVFICRYKKRSDLSTLILQKLNIQAIYRTVNKPTQSEAQDKIKKMWDCFSFTKRRGKKTNRVAQHHSRDSMKHKISSPRLNNLNTKHPITGGHTRRKKQKEKNGNLTHQN